MDAELKERAQKVAGLTRNQRRAAGALPEIKEVYFLLTGQTVTCTFCNVDDLVSRISQQLIKEPLILKDMASKIHFKHSNSKMEVIRITEHGPVKITSENLNEGDNAAFVSKHYGHLVEEAPKKNEPAESEAKTESKTSAKK